ncbi:MAG: metallophosphoesterase [Planctomycetota bacterium]|nr:MAG: metallophosphoesterase [Planctomycetota bacterium]
MQKIVRLFIPVLSLVMGCAGGQAGRQVHLPIKIGLLADSQLTSDKSKIMDTGYRSKFMDKNLGKVAIRPPAIERCLAKEMLDIALEKLSQENVDLILYLGDGANSGGTDEIESLFESLEDNRSKSGIPTYIVIGNHDYLGLGMTTNVIDRHTILNPIGRTINPPLSKYQVLKRISTFNKMNNSGVFRYKDYLSSSDPNLGHRDGLYLVGHLEYVVPGQDSVDIFLVDSSDYKDSRKPEMGGLKHFVRTEQYYGAKGAMSFKDEPDKNKVSQITYIEKLASSSRPAIRFMASHYPPDHLDRIRLADPEDDLLVGVEAVGHAIWEVPLSPLGLSTPPPEDHLKRGLSKGGKNYWLSGHTHVKKMTRSPQKLDCGGIFGFFSEGKFGCINVGSTTDYRAHVAVVEAFDNNKPGMVKVDRNVGYREIPLFDPKRPDDKQCLKRMLRDVALYAIKHGGDGVTLLGLNKEYQKKYWTEDHTEASVENLKSFIDKFVADHPEYDRSDVTACLGFIAAAYEIGINPKRFVK